MDIKMRKGLAELHRCFPEMYNCWSEPLTDDVPPIHVLLLDEFIIDSIANNEVVDTQFMRCLETGGPIVYQIVIRLEKRIDATNVDAVKGHLMKYCTSITHLVIESADNYNAVCSFLYLIGAC